MSDTKVPQIGTRVEVLSRYSLMWMNEYRRPSVGVVAHSNPWDKPGTFRIINPRHPLGESVINLDNVESIKILDDEPGESRTNDIRSVEIQGSKGDIYLVTLDGERSSCTCPAGRNGRACKHVKAARELSV